ncbi:hypothetical protein NC653_034705 [Populus alba x Populus x berolinensis]|uniref:Uncharacterized protein n=1 Tax=Populus alba x Populus x berolinensis TaxID=444605 RepID=A0AAD6LN86_9ROSI|nr:hypothetical protein NC653_034705 [Populus alba x Populus x berolinensis]
MGEFCERIVGGREMRRSKTSEVIAMVGGSEYREAMINHIMEMSKLTQPDQNPYQNPDSKGAKNKAEQPG